MLCLCCVALFGQIGKIRNVSNVKVFVFVFVFVCFFVKAASLPFVQTEARLQRKSDGRSSELIAQAFLLSDRKIFKPAFYQTCPPLTHDIRHLVKLLNSFIFYLLCNSFIFYFLCI